MASDNPTRTRRRLLIAIAAGLLLLMPCAIVLQTGADAAKSWLLAGVALGTLVALPASLALTALQLRALRRPALDDELNDELANRNSVRAMAVGYIAAIAVAGTALPLAAWFAWPALPPLTAVVLAGVAAHLASFAWLERQGDDGAA